MSMDEMTKARVDLLISEVAGEAAAFAADLVVFAEAVALLRKGAQTDQPVSIAPEKAKVLLRMIDVLRAGPKDA